MNKEFFDAVRAGDSAKVSTMLAADASLLSARDERGVSAFALSKYSRQNEVAALLLENGLTLDIFDASMAGATDRVLELLGRDQALVNSYSPDGWTPLHLAAFFSQPKAVETLLERGADVHTRAKNGTNNQPLHAATAGRNVEVVRLLVARGADVNARQEGGWTALHSAAQSGDVEMARLLIAAGAEVGARASNNQNALDLALTKGHQAMVNLLDEYAAGAHGAS
jgi:ankyrin repeat protein